MCTACKRIYPGVGKLLLYATTGLNQDEQAIRWIVCKICLKENDVTIRLEKAKKELDELNTEKAWYLLSMFVVSLIGVLVVSANYLLWDYRFLYLVGISLGVAAYLFWRKTKEISKKIDKLPIY